MLSCEFSETYKNTFSTEHLWTNDSVHHYWNSHCKKFHENSYFAKALFCLAGSRSFFHYFFYLEASKLWQWNFLTFFKSFTDFFQKLWPHDFTRYPKTFQKGLFCNFCLNLPFFSYIPVYMSLEITFRNNFCKSPQRYCYTSQTSNCVA